MLNANYYPIIKWKKGEQSALQHFGADANFIPVIELVDDCDPETFFRDVAFYYNRPVYYDTLRCDDDKRNLLLQFMEHSSNLQIDAWPLIYVNDAYTILNEITKKSSRFAVKLPIPEDFDGPSNEDVIRLLSQHTKNKAIDLFLDAGVVLNSKDANNVYANYKSIFTSLSNTFKDFNQVIVCLTSFPEEIKIDSGENCQFDRYDIKIFKQLLKFVREKELELAYSDYGVTKFTDSEFDFRMLRYGILPKVKYTTYDFYFVSKGKKDHSIGIFTRSYNDIADEIIHSKFYFGKDFSYGDKIIFDKATNPEAKPGNSTNWVTYCANHHIAVLIEQLSNLIGA